MTIEDHKAEAGTKKLRGRKPGYESRGTEIRQRLISWKAMPKASRPSLRALEAETGVSHQLFSFYLKGLEKWQAHERAKQLRAEGRHFTAGLLEAMVDNIEKLKQAAKRGPLNSYQVKTLKVLAKHFPAAQEVLAMSRAMTPQEERQARAAEKATMFAAAAVKNIDRIKQEAERGPLPWRDIEILKILARRKCAEAKELLQKHACSALPPPQGVTQ